MSKAKILVAGATGNTGGAVVRELLEKGWPVRALVRSRDHRAEALERKGAEIAVADLFDPEQLTHAMRGAQRAYFLPPYHPSMIQSAASFAVAAQEAKLEVIVGMSQWLASPSHPATLTRQHWIADELFKSLPGIAYVSVNPGYFADNYLRLIDFAAQLGLFPNLTGNSRNAPPSNEDIARVAAACLMDPAKHASRSYRPTGPKLIDASETAATLSRVLQRKVRAVPMPLWLFLKAARLRGSVPSSSAALPITCKITNKAPSSLALRRTMSWKSLDSLRKISRSRRAATSPCRKHSAVSPKAFAPGPTSCVPRSVPDITSAVMNAT